MENAKKLKEMQEDLRRRVVGAMKHGLPVHVAMATLGHRRIERILHPTIGGIDIYWFNMLQWGLSNSWG